MEQRTILGYDVHDAIIGLKRAIEHNRLQVNSASTIRELEQITFGPDGKIDPATVGPGARALARSYIGAHPEDWQTR